VNVGEWLRRLRLEQYERAFSENDVDVSVLPELTTEDLVGLGVTSIGHRRRLLGAIAALRDEVISARGSTGYPAAPGAERRQLTVMFCDLVGSTALSARLDPEDLREIISAYHRAVRQVIVECGGLIARYMGDGVLVYFGYPQAHEDDAERAVRAGLAAIDAVDRIDVNSVKLQARVGIATGLVVVGDLIGEGLAQEQSVVGETPNLAARLQALAEPNTVVIAESTHRLVGALFEYRDLGAVKVKGIAPSVSAWQPLRPSVVASRFEALRGTVLSGLVGRDEEVNLLLHRWERAKAGDGQIILVSGEAGIGKSRVTAALMERLRAEPALHVRYFCSPYHQDSALYPFVDELGRAAGLTRGDPATAKLSKLEALAARAAPTDEDVAFLADLLSLSAPERHPLPNLSPQRKKERSMEALLRQIEGLARQKPLLIVFEDAHWIDPTSRELLDLAVERIRNLPVMLVVTFRPEFQPPWIGQPRVGVLVLSRLDRRDRRALVLQLTAGKALPDEVVDQIADRGDGVPLFVEELTKSVLESGLLREEADRYVLEHAVPPLAIPTSLHDSLMARLDRLGSVRRVAQIGAAIGREFSYVLLLAVSALSDDELQAALARLVASELILERGTPPDAVYAFKHTLVQDVAHASLLRDARQELHAQIAQALEAHSPELMDSQPWIFALHYAEAGLVEKSAAFWGKAGHASAARSAMAEAVAQFQKALNQLALLPESPERQRQELVFWSALGAALRFVKGQATPQVGHAFASARALWEKLGLPPEFLHIPYGQAFYHIYRGEFELAQRLNEDLLRRSRERGDRAGLVLARASAGRTLMYIGSFAAARSHLEEVLVLYDPIAHAALAEQGGNHPRLSAMGQLGIALFCLGFPDRALAQSNTAIAEAVTLAHAPSLAANLAIGARLFALAGDHAALDRCATPLMEIASDQGFPFYRALATIYIGWSKVLGGEIEKGLSLLRTGISAHDATGVETQISFYVALSAKAYEIAGQVDEALSLADDALQIAERIGERWFAAELYRHKGQLLARRGDAEAAEEVYGKALGIAIEQDTKLWELRAALGLARLRHEQGRHAEAHDLLSPVYGWFTEGFDMEDLKGARALLDELRC